MKDILYVISVLLNVILCANCFFLAKELSKAEKMLDRSIQLLDEKEEK